MINVEGASSASWPAYERVDPTQTAENTPRKTESLKPPTQQDFEIATRFGPNGVTMKSLDQLGFAKVDRDRFNPAERKATVNPYDRVLESLRMAAMRRDAAATAVQPPAVVEAATVTPAETAEIVDATPSLAYAPTGPTTGTGPAEPSAPVVTEPTPEPTAEPAPTDTGTGTTETSGTSGGSGNGAENGNGKGKGLLGGLL